MLEIFRPYKNVIEEKYYPEERKQVNDIEKYGKKVFEKFLLTSKERSEKFLMNPTLKKPKNGTRFKFVHPINNKRATLYPNLREATLNTIRDNRLIISGLLKMDSAVAYYPNANGTMRLSYGTVGGYYTAFKQIYKNASILIFVLYAISMLKLTLN